MKCKAVACTSYCHAVDTFQVLNQKQDRVCLPQIAAIMLAPAFPGVLAPLRFNPVRFEEFAGFAVTLCGTWVGTALLLGAYNKDSTSGSMLPGLALTTSDAHLCAEIQVPVSASPLQALSARASA